MIKKKKVPKWKREEVEQLYNLFQEYNNIAVVPVKGLPDRQIQAMRKKLRGDAILRMSKVSLIHRAIEKYKGETDKKNLDKLAEDIPGQASLLFTDMDIMDLKQIFEENKWMVAAKPNDVAPVDIVVPKGDTGLPTGQVISELNVTLKLPTRIENDTIWVRKDTVTHEKGEIVDVKEAAVLKKLGIRPVESVIKIHYAWCDGEILPKDIIYMDVEEFQKDIASHYLIAFNLALELGVIDEETIEPLMQKGYREGLALMFEMPILVEDMIEEYFKKATSTANTLNAMIFGAQQAATSSTTDEKEEEDEEEEEEEEEAAGIGGLFG
jgi:large subunit ribosomal protein L10